MSFSIRKDGDRIVIGMPAKLGIGARQELEDAVLDQLERGERKFLIDFSGTRKIDSRGISLLLSLSERIVKETGELRLANLNDSLKRLFALTRLETLFQPWDEGDGLAGRSAPLGPRPPGSRDGSAEP